MKDMSRALRRHHNARLKQARRFYHGFDQATEPRRLGMALNTPAPCSCFMCGHRRRHLGPKLAELAHAIKLREET